MYRIIAIGLCAAAVAGCGGGGGNGSVGNEPPPDGATAAELFDFYQAAYTARTDRLDELNNTAWVAPVVEGMPTTGTAAFEGYIDVVLDTPTAQTELLGDTRLSADFDAGTIAGQATNFAGRDANGDYDLYTGTMTLADGKIGAVRPNDFDIGYKGTLTGNGDKVVVLGSMDGKFKGDPVRGILAEDTDPTASVDGTAVTGSITMAVELTTRTVAPVDPTLP